MDEEIEAVGAHSDSRPSVMKRPVFSTEPCPDATLEIDDCPKARRRLSRLSNDQRPVTRGERFLRGPFESVMAGLILISALLLFVQLELRGIELGVPLEFTSVGDAWYGSDKVFQIIEHAFNSAFIVELVVRISILRMDFFFDPYVRKWDRFNIFDLVVVTLCTVDLWVVPFALSVTSGGEPPNGSNLLVLRLVRLVRLSRGLKVIRVMKSFSKLRILLCTVGASFLVLLWSMVLLGLLNFGAAIFLCQTLQGALEDGDLDFETRRWVYQMYGTAGRAMWTVFEITFSGGWPNYARPVIEKVNWAYTIFFAIYVSIVVFAVTRIVTALFLSDTLQIAANDAEMMVHESMSKRLAYTQKLRELFELADKSDDGLVSLRELEEVCQIPQVRMYMNALELEVNEAEALFRMLDSGRGQVSLDEFVAGVMRLKGQARSMDLIEVARNCEGILARCRGMEKTLRQLTCKLNTISRVGGVLER